MNGHFTLDKLIGFLGCIRSQQMIPNRESATLSEKKARLGTWNTEVANCIDICVYIYIV